MNARQMLATLSAVVVAGTFAAHAGPARAAVPLVRLPNGSYTVPHRELAGKGWRGDITYRAAGMKTIVTTTVYGQQRAFDLHPGKNCSQLGAGATIPLKPSMIGIPTQTIVSLPITQLRGNYVVEARNATERSQRAEACGAV